MLRLHSSENSLTLFRRFVLYRRVLPAALLILFAGVLAVATGKAQSPTPTPPAQPDQTAPDAGGPGGDTGVIAVPKKKDAPEEAAPLPPAPAERKITNPEGMPSTSIRIEVPEVSVDVGVLLEKTHQFVPGLKPSNFRVYEDGVEQKVVGFKRVEAPITALMICEFASPRNMNSYGGYMLIRDMRNSAFAFAEQLRPQDYVALMTFDMRNQIQLDFTQDKKELLQAIDSLRVPGFSETNLFDAVAEGLDRLSRVEGQKYIILVASGRDTFSKLTLDKILKKIKESENITIYTISTGGMMRAMGGDSITMLQADNEMKTFSGLTGGASYFPRFQGELPDDFGQINQNIRSKYQLVYHPTNPKQDGTYRKLRVALVDDEGKPLQMQDEKHKPLKYDIIARDGYRARPEVE
ncbi:MAG: VWA domain-containing protein [Terracidiphilus sp.]